MSGLFGENITRIGHKSVEWYTPYWIFRDLGIDFDLDPCSPHDTETHVPAAQKYTVFDDGLSKEWEGRVWLNPPYGKETPFWMRRMIDHGNGIALVFSRTDAKWCQESMAAADGILFFSGRIEFVPGKENAHKRSRSGAGSVFFSFGYESTMALKNLEKSGFFIARNPFTI